MLGIQDGKESGTEGAGRERRSYAEGASVKERASRINDLSGGIVQGRVNFLFVPVAA